MVSGDRRAGLSCSSAITSEAMRPGQRELVTMTRLGPLGRGCLAARAAQSNSSSMDSTRMMPARLKAAS
jgi:hypothetical protein